MNIDNFIIKSFDQFTGFNRSTGELEVVMDELNDFTFSQEEEKQDVTGRGGRIIGSIKKNKKVTGKGSNGYLTGGALATLLGCEIEEGKQLIKYTDTISIQNNSGSTNKKAVGTIGNEIGTIYVRDINNAYISGGKRLIQVAAEPKTGEFTYDPETKAITLFAGDIPDNTEVIAFYYTEIDGKKLSNDANSYSKVLDSFIDVTCSDACDNLFHGQFIISRADFSGTFDISGGSDASKLSFEFTSLPDSCSGKTKLWDFIIFD